MKKEDIELSFRSFNELMQCNFKDLYKTHDFIFTTETNKDNLWELYLDSFPSGTNEIYRERREFDCSCCRHFIKQFGNVVFIVDNKLISIWDFKTNDIKYSTVIKQLSKYVKSKSVQDVYLSNEKRMGTAYNFEEGETTKKWEHFFIDLPNKFINTNRDTIPEKKNEYRTGKQVFERSLNEISQEAIETVTDLIAQNSLYKGNEWKSVLTKFLFLYKKYHKLRTLKEKNNFCWINSAIEGGVISKIKNHSIGTLLMDISDGTDLNESVKKYEAIVAPANYKRPKAIFTKKMLEEAKNKIEELGLKDSLQRRYAILEDVNINNVLFANRDVVSRLQSNDVFEEMEQEIAINPKSFDKVEEIPVKDFIENVLPTTISMEIYFENKHSSNMVSLIAPFKKDSKTMFKWNNNFSWAYSGNITDSDIKKNVKSAGGKVDGVLRFSIQWNDGIEHNKDDYDAHCIEPKGFEIYYSRKRNTSTTGNLDVDIINPDVGIPAVENITWVNKDKMEKGKYQFFVHNYSHRGGSDGFRAEIEFDGQIHRFNYTKSLRQNENVHVAEVTFDNNSFEIKNKLPSETSSVEVWNLKTNSFVPVSTVMYSPNYWDEQKGIGNKHFLFMLKDCNNNETPNGFFNEFLGNDLMKHKRVFEALGTKMKVENMENQLSGLGFSSTKRNSLVCKVEGHISRIIKIVF